MNVDFETWWKNMDDSVNRFRSICAHHGGNLVAPNRISLEQGDKIADPDELKQKVGHLKKEIEGLDIDHLPPNLRHPARNLVKASTETEWTDIESVRSLQKYFDRFVDAK